MQVDHITANNLQRQRTARAVAIRADFPADYGLKRAALGFTASMSGLLAVVFYLSQL